MDFSAYFMYLAETVTWLVAVVIVLMVIAGVIASSKSEGENKAGIDIKSYNERLEKYKKKIQHKILDKQALKELKKAEKKSAKEQEKSADKKDNAYVLAFDGDMKASQVSALREEISAILLTAQNGDEVILRLESPGGMVHGYGLAASQLQRIKDAGLSLTVCVDKVAASGGYMMACIADKIISAPFAVIGSIGVVAQIPNIHKLLKKNDVDVELHTAGKFKRTLTMIAENTEEGREKFKEDLNETHELFKQFVQRNRRRLDIDTVATGEVWYGSDAIEQNLIDEIATSDDYINKTCEQKAVWTVQYKVKKSPMDKFTNKSASALERVFERQLQKTANYLWFK